MKTINQNKNHELAPRQIKKRGRFFERWNQQSARSRIFTYFLIYTLLMLVVIWLLQTVFLYDIYKAQMKNLLSRTSQTIARNIDNENLGSLVERFASQNNLCISVMDENMRTLQEAENLFPCIIHHLAPHTLKRLVESIEKDNTVSYFVQPMNAFQNRKYDERKFVGSVPPSDDGGILSVISVEKVVGESGKIYYILLNGKLTPLEGTVNIIREELVFITIALLLLAFVISLLLSKWMTRPIIEITEASAALKNRQYTPIAHANYREVRQLNKRLSETAEELRHVEVMQKELVANISHDLRTPLTLIQGYAEMMRDIPGENNPENMQVIVDETQRLSTLVESILKLNSLQRGQVSSEIRSFSANALINTLQDRYQKLTAMKGFILRYEQTEDLTLYTDPLQFEQVLQNLINNALTYTGSDQTVVIRQTRQEHTARFEVIDSGEGIAPEDLPYIWERYYRSGKPHKRATVGSGLGLNIVRNLLDAGGLPYGVNSNPGEGSNFWFEAALAESEDEKPAENFDSFPENGNTKPSARDWNKD